MGQPVVDGYLVPAVSRGVPDRSLHFAQSDQRHQSLRRSVGRFWSARIALDYRALRIDCDDRIIWFWIGTHAAYNELIRNR